MSVIVPLHLPKANLKLTRKGNEVFVWCVIRKKTLLLTPEEWVRQHIIHYLVNDLKIPLGRIASEFPIRLNEMQRRCDIVVFDAFANPIMIVECKAPEVGLTEEVFHQIAHYNRQLQVDYLMVSNGLQHIYAKINKENGALDYLKDLTSVKWSQ